MIDFYGRFLQYQHQGMTDALSLPSVLAAFEIDKTPQDDRPDMTQRLLLWHSYVAAATRED